MTYAQPNLFGIIPPLGTFWLKRGGLPERCMKKAPSELPKWYIILPAFPDKREIQVKYPKIKVRLTGKNGNAFFVLGTVLRALRRGKVSQSKIDKFIKDATANDYSHLLRTCMDWVSIS